MTGPIRTETLVRARVGSGEAVPDAPGDSAPPLDAGLADACGLGDSDGDQAETAMVTTAAIARMERTFIRWLLLGDASVDRA